MTRRWLINTAVVVVLTLWAAYLAFVEHVPAAFFALVALVLLVIVRAYLAYLAWLSRPGQRGIKLLAAGGVLGYLHDRSSGRGNQFVRLLIGGPHLLLVHDADDEQD